MEARVFRTAIVGLGRSDVLALQQALGELYRQQRFEWVGANDAQLDFLLINSFFISSTSINKIIEQHQIPYLIVERQHRPVAVEGQTLYLPLQEMHSLKQWLDDYLLPRAATNPTPTPAGSAPHQREAGPPQSLAPSHSAPLVASEPSLGASGETLDRLDTLSRENLIHAVRDMLLPCSGPWLLTDAKQHTALIDVAQQLVWLQPARAQGTPQSCLLLPIGVKGLSSLQARQLQASATPLDLRQWLWQLAWQLQPTAGLLPETQQVKLKIWPQPLAGGQHNLILRSCALLKQQVASASQLSRQLNLPLADARVLLTTLVAVGFASVCPQPPVLEAAPVLAPAAPEPAPLKGFFARLRSKLGF